MVQSNAPAEILPAPHSAPPDQSAYLAASARAQRQQHRQLHELLQIAFDWSDFHLHRFVIRGKEYGLSRIGCTTFRTDARKALLSQFHFRVNERFLYEYDFDDLWQHQIRFEGIQPVCEKKLYPVCVGGSCTSPPRRLRWSGSLHGENGPSPLGSAPG
jgi:pRiA4b ORF-3-like protein